MPFETITDPDDERVAPFRAIRERDLVGRRGHFIVEGTVVLRVLSQVHGRVFRADRILVLENRLSGISDILADFPADVPVYVCDAGVMNAIAGFDMHRGVLALGTRSATADPVQLVESLPEDALVAVAIGLSNHDNAGSLFRNATAFGADAVLLDETSCDPLYRKSLRVSVGSVLRMPWIRAGNGQNLLTMLAEAGFQILTLSPAGETTIDHLQPSRRTALVLGTEGDGLPAAIMQRFSPVRIAQSPELDSLNVSMAAGIALYELALKKQRIG
ncbi:RNA methyltransferase [Martelella alba]|uniref:RNA methyltransferase n=1 Tax=Martelella alba TaxID=2590451 RepID=A0A506UE04_9HYPH|nr:RNA methyltransferase [Martelella alba]TPW30899.1 RNA methyltransferase [Martelella alba]